MTTIRIRPAIPTSYVDGIAQASREQITDKEETVNGRTYRVHVVGNTAFPTLGQAIAHAEGERATLAQYAAWAPSVIAFRDLRFH